MKIVFKTPKAAEELFNQLLEKNPNKRKWITKTGPELFQKIYTLCDDEEDIDYNCPFCLETGPVDLQIMVDDTECDPMIRCLGCNAYAFFDLDSIREEKTADGYSYSIDFCQINKIDGVHVEPCFNAYLHRELFKSQFVDVEVSDSRNNKFEVSFFYNC